MCGIAAFSLTPGSKVNARALGHALLTQIEQRGSHASGFAYVDRDGNPGIYKQPKPGSQLSLAEMPRNASSAVLHTRYATQGHQSDNRNNHPVVSTDGRIALVHNGVISNDHLLCAGLGITKEEHGEVDSLVIPSLIAQGGVKDLSRLAGYAAIAWIDGHEGNGVIRIARLKTSPVSYTHLRDGSFVMASTGILLRNALESLDLEYGGIFELADGRLISVYDGWVYHHAAAPAMTYSHQAWRQHSNATAGGHGTGTQTGTRQSTYTGASAAGGSQTATPTTPATGPTGAVGSEVVKSGSTAVFPTSTNADGTRRSESEIYAELEEWRKKRDAEDAATAAAVAKTVEQVESTRTADTPMIFDFRSADSMTEDEWDDYVDAAMKDMESREAPGNADDAMACTVGSRYTAGEGYYIVDHEGDMSHYPTLDDLEKQLAWIAKMGKSDQDLFEVDDKINWINHVLDMGSVDEDGNLISWVEDMADIDNHESPAIRHLNYIREGVGRLTTLKGA